jgi:hypothetical protein
MGIIYTPYSDINQNIIDQIDAFIKWKN